MGRVGVDLELDEPVFKVLANLAEEDNISVEALIEQVVMEFVEEDCGMTCDDEDYYED